MRRPDELRLAGISLPVCAMVWLLAVTPGQSAEEAAVDFDRDVRSILADNCFHCHGPDAGQRQADLRLDTRTGAFAPRDGHQTITPGKPQQSELFRRIAATDPEERMPPADSDRSLSAAEIETIRRWIASGAEWKEHWAFVAPQRPELPTIQQSNWPRNPIDHFILARLEKEGLTPSAEADRETLIRRVTLDLTGLPPTLAEIDDFLADRSPDAYEKVVDRLLASPRYGERMALSWLDAARYADTSGYQSDGPREMWRWRDWVIEAYNRNLPFDRFTVEQLAGDLLPDPTLDQRIATGFNRNHRGNAEGGIIPEEYAVEYVVDRVETTSTVWLGLTMGCARCHDHKFDPFSQEEFYQVYAFFNNIPEHGRAIKEGNSPPYIKSPTKKQQQQLQQLDEQLAVARSRFDALQPEIIAAREQWEKTFAASHPLDGEQVDWFPSRGLIAHFPLDEPRSAAADAAAGDDSATADAGKSPKTAPAEAGHVLQARDGDVRQVEGTHGSAVGFVEGSYLDAGDTADFGYFDSFTISLWVHPAAKSGTLISRMTDTARADGYALRLEDGRLQVNLVKRWLDDSIRVQTHDEIPQNQWSHLTVTYDGSRVARGIRVYRDGQPLELDVKLDAINQTFATKEPLRLAAGGGPDDRFTGLLDEVRIYNRAVKLEEARLLASRRSVTEIVHTPAEKRTPAESEKLRTYYLEVAGEKSHRQAWANLQKLVRQRAALIETFPTTMVMQENEEIAPTHLLIRGEYDKPGKQVQRDVPASLLPLPQDAPRDRLGLARWIVDPTNPLTARVAVNRYWQMHFGIGLVKTTEDFGTQGERPSHPRLLDWLATEFVHTGWDIKQMHRLIVTSATYRQASDVTAPGRDRDPENRLLARGPRFRLSAQTIRDQALFASGLLVERLGGPSVKPYQPEGLWQEIASAGKYDQSHGDDLYRRSMYTFWKRTVAPPAMVAFDATARETCIVRTERTNTPLQALTLMNDVTFLEAARVLAERTLSEVESSPADRLTRMFRRLTSRRPTARELQVLERAYQHHHRRYLDTPEAAKTFISIGEKPLRPGLDAADVAACSIVAGMILNLDEVMTRE